MRRSGVLSAYRGGAAPRAIAPWLLAALAFVAVVVLLGWPW
jgi:hypothetical protein